MRYRIARNFGGQNFGKCPRFCVWRLIFRRPAPGSRIAVIEKQILAPDFGGCLTIRQIRQNFSPPKYLAIRYNV